MPRQHEAMSSCRDNRLMAVLTLLVVPVTFCCVLYLDLPLAAWIRQLLRSVHLLQHASSNIPDILLILVCISTSVLWLAYLLCFRRHGSVRQLQFLQVAATAVPTAYLLKALLQFAFGRTNTRLWLSGAAPMEFSWFHGGGIGCFPSGHMTVFTTFFVALCWYYPSYRLPAAALLLMLAGALLGTGYHFLGDVVAGAYLGILVVYLTRHCLAVSCRDEYRFLANQLR